MSGRLNSPSFSLTNSKLADNLLSRGIIKNCKTSACLCVFMCMCKCMAASMSFADTNKALLLLCFTAAVMEISGGDVLFWAQCLCQWLQESKTFDRDFVWQLCEILTSWKVSWEHRSEWEGHLTFSLFVSLCCQYFPYSFPCSLRVSLIFLSLIISIIIFSICSERRRHKVSPSQHEQLHLFPYIIVCLTPTYSLYMEPITEYTRPHYSH